MHKCNQPPNIQGQFLQLLSHIIKLKLIEAPALADEGWEKNQQGGYYYQRPITQQAQSDGPCCYYYERREYGSNSPVLIVTTLSEQLKRYADNTLIIFQDLSYYIGQVVDCETGFLVANGKGVVVNREMIFQGMFQKGRPYGFGHFMAPGLRYYGQIANCNPLGQCLQRTKQGLFVGEIGPHSKKGVRFLPSNEQIHVVEER